MDFSILFMTPFDEKNKVPGYAIDIPKRDIGLNALDELHSKHGKAIALKDIYGWRPAVLKNPLLKIPVETAFQMRGVFAESHKVEIIVPPASLNDFVTFEWELMHRHHPDHPGQWCLGSSVNDADILLNWEQDKKDNTTWQPNAKEVPF